jgi:lipopolysaccharide biosynthesis glycosyltransferase
MRIFIGHDSILAQNTEVCEKSIRRYEPNAIITRIDINEMRKLGYNREEDGSTEFTYTRFLVPLLCEYQGLALFCDSDFVWQESPMSVASYSESSNVVSVVKHLAWTPDPTKMDGRKNESYDRKWWSSLMLFNCSHPLAKRLDIKEINMSTPAYLHRLWWAEQNIGSLPSRFNHLVGYDSHSDDIAAYHFTNGTPIHRGQNFGPCVGKYLEYL